MDSFYAWEENTLILNVLGRARAKYDRIGKVKGNQLKVNVTAAPEDGKATKHMARFLAKEFGVPTSSIEIVFGATSPNKRFRIKGPNRIPPVRGLE